MATDEAATAAHRAAPEAEPARVRERALRIRPRAVTAAIVSLGLIPLGLIAADAVRNELGANPIEAISHRTGSWALRLLVVTLCVSPLRRLTGLAWLAPQRRWLGLLAFLYAVLHVANYVVLDLELRWGDVGSEIAERPYLTVGFAGFVMLLALAITSTRGWQRRLGRRWQTLHLLIHPAAIAAVVHFLWLVKRDLREPLVYAALVALLLALRLPPGRRALAGARTALAARGGR